MAKQAIRIALAGGAAALGLVLAASPASATVQTFNPDANIAATPYTISFGAAGGLTFSDVAGSTTAFESSIGVATTGSVEVFSLAGAPDYFQLFSRAPFPSADAGGFATYASAAGVPYSMAQGLVGFEYTLGDGAHYGLARIGGDVVDAYYLQSSPGSDLSAAVPEPSVWAMLVAGAALLGASLRRRRRRTATRPLTLPINVT